MAVVLDSDAVIGFLDRDDALHDAADAAIRRVIHDRLLVSVITYAEVMTGVRLGHHDDVHVAGFFRGLVSESSRWNRRSRRRRRNCELFIGLCRCPTP